MIVAFSKTPPQGSPADLINRARLLVGSRVELLEPVHWGKTGYVRKVVVERPGFVEVAASGVVHIVAASSLREVHGAQAHY